MIGGATHLRLRLVMMLMLLWLLMRSVTWWRRQTALPLMREREQRWRVPLACCWLLALLVRPKGRQHPRPSPPHRSERACGW